MNQYNIYQDTDGDWIVHEARFPEGHRLGFVATYQKKDEAQNHTDYLNIPKLA